MKKVVEMVEVKEIEIKESKIYSSVIKGRIINCSVNGVVMNSLTQCILSLNSQWSNKSVDAIRLWNRVNSQLSKKGSCQIEFEGKKYDFSVVKLEK